MFRNLSGIRSLSVNFLKFCLCLLMLNARESRRCLDHHKSIRLVSSDTHVDLMFSDLGHDFGHVLLFYDVK